MLDVVEALKGKSVEDVSLEIKNFLDALARCVALSDQTNMSIDINAWRRTLANVQSGLRDLHLTSKSRKKAILRRERVAEQISGYKADIDNCLQRFQV
jgi:hypothetical protein